MTELLDRLHLCRAHRLYVGGGSSYAVLPNTDRTRETLEACLRSVNQWLLKRFSGALQFLYAWEPCSGPQLKNEGGTAYQEIFARLENKLNQKRNRRFDASGLTWLNSQKMSDPERECRVCAGSSLPLDGDDLCPVCREFRDSSSGLAATGKVAAVCRAVWEEGGTPLTLPSLDGQDWFVYMMDRAQADRLRAEQPGTVVRVYAPWVAGAMRIFRSRSALMHIRSMKKWRRLRALRRVPRASGVWASCGRMWTTWDGHSSEGSTGVCSPGKPVPASL